MAQLIGQFSGINVTRYVGPALSERYQVTNTETGQFVQVSAEQLHALGVWFHYHSFGPVAIDDDHPDFDHLPASSEIESAEQRRELRNG